MGSAIEWTDETWNPTTGCTRVSSGCDHCYAVRHTIRLAGQFEEYQGLVNPGKKHFNGVVKTHEERLEQPLHWRKPRKVFVDSMSDLFHEAVPFEFIDRVFAVMALTPQHRYQILTKRPERMAEYLSDADLPYRLGKPAAWIWGGADPDGVHDQASQRPWPLPNVWLGTSVENQEAADERVPHLLRCPAAVRFLSCEPLLGPVRLACAYEADSGGGLPFPTCGQSEPTNELHWVIAGGESGPGARPMHPDWVRSIRDECEAARVAFFFKQWGAWAPDRDALDRSRDVRQVRYEGHERDAVGMEEHAVQPAWMQRVGKKEAGRELDGETWDEFPAAAEVPA